MTRKPLIRDGQPHESPARCAVAANSFSHHRQTTLRVGALKRELIASALALGIGATGLWSLRDIRAPYHPEPVADGLSFRDEDVGPGGVAMVSLRRR